jgi:hypothetical protein
MKKVLASPVQLWHLVLVAVLVSVLTSTVTVSAAPLSALWPAGTIRMAAVSDNGDNNIVIPADYSNVAVLEQVINIPAGKRGDLMVMGEVDIQTDNSTTHYQYCWGDIRFDNINAVNKIFKPGTPYMLEAWGNIDRVPYSLSLPINGYRQNLPAGDHTIYMVMSAGYGECNARTRSMMIFMNIHN